METYIGTGQRNMSPDTASAAYARITRLDDPAAYRPSPEARDAVNVALMTGMPLLISGDPGSGKTQLGYAVAHELGLAEPDLYLTKSTSQARDLFYRYDALRHFRAVQTGGSSDPTAFLELAALGRAINRALPEPERLPFADPAERAEPQARSLVIVDEIDKAPRDFPNDLLFEMDQLRFRVGELGRYETPPISDGYRPLLFITTNAEQLLPEAFLRRCVFVHLVPPRGDVLAELIERRFQGILAHDHPLVRDVVRIADDLKDRAQIERAPSSAEVLQFLNALLGAGGDPALPLAEQPMAPASFASLLAKSAPDFEWLIHHLPARTVD